VRPRDRAVSFGSKEALVETGSECAKQLSFTDRPLRWTAQQILSKIAEVFAKILRAVSERLYDIERLSERQNSRHSQQKLLSNAVAGL
jgi:Mg2+ and Co2+ transporter CorA